LHVVPVVWWREWEKLAREARLVSSKEANCEAKSRDCSNATQANAKVMKP
jgi:hypothetical protein